jgi:hypothetical protein
MCSLVSITSPLADVTETIDAERFFFHLVDVYIQVVFVTPYLYCTRSRFRSSFTNKKRSTLIAPQEVLRCIDINEREKSHNEGVVAVDSKHTTVSMISNKITWTDDFIGGTIAVAVNPPISLFLVILQWLLPLIAVTLAYYLWSSREH